MKRLVTAEIGKLLSTRLWLWLLLASMALTALFAGLALAFWDAPDNPTPPLVTAAGQRTLFSVAHGAAGPLAAVLAAVGVTGEFRHRTASTTFLATPRRSRVVVAKLVTAALAGLAYALMGIAVTVAVAVPGLRAESIPVTLSGNAIPATFAGVIAGVVLLALIGVGLGALVRDQTATVVTLLIYLFIVEPVVTRIPALQSWARYLPGAASDALAHVAQANQALVEPWLGGVVLTGYTAVLAAAGIRATIRRDMT